MPTIIVHTHTCIDIYLYVLCALYVAKNAHTVGAVRKRFWPKAFLLLLLLLFAVDVDVAAAAACDLPLLFVAEGQTTCNSDKS